MTLTLAARRPQRRVICATLLCLTVIELVARPVEGDLYHGVPGHLGSEVSVGQPIPL